MTDKYGAPSRREERPLAGEGGTQKLRFFAQKTGSGTLILIDRPARDSSALADETFGITAQISPS